ncbi:hypothetical protein [Streptosporangium amethystogenes]|uniref:hypothetical protein n=1 Tax=Streptosporangium amethystogenes TaxID=2002 RepID=UPI0007C7B201|nr:hypothetical protein [Streptosporangium amethystogenes]
MDRYAWLPSHQQHAAYSLAHADNLIERAGRIALDHTRRGTVTLNDIVVGDFATMTVTGVVPLPQAMVRLASDALNQLRSTLEHVLYAEIEHRVDAPLTSGQARGVEMPCTSSVDKLQEWATRRPRRDVDVLQPGRDLYRRIADLQPFHRRNSQDAHPLKVLVEHTNHSKHRTPSLAATLIGAVTPDRPSDDIQVTMPSDRPVQVGDVLARLPVGRVVEVNLWPKVSIQRPHTQTWHILIHELRDLESWVRQTALPTLIAGSTDVSPLPPHLDITVGYADFRTALDAASPAPAADRLEKLVGAEMAREGLPGILLLHPHGVPHGQALTAWAATLSDDEVLQRFESLHGLEWHDFDATVRAMIDEALNGHRGPTGPLHPAPRPHAQP